jgi:hypothetical protein
MILITCNKSLYRKGEKSVKLLQKTCLTVVIIGLLTSVSFGQTKLAQTGFNFLSISSDARASAMGEAVNSLSGLSGAMSHNPGSMAEMPTLLDASFSINKWIADINYLSFSLILSPASGDYGNIGFSVQAVDYGDIEGTMVNRNDPNGYVETGLIKPTALAIGFGYSKMLNDQFGVGGRVKYAVQKLGESTFMSSGGDVSTKQNKAEAIAFDFGTVYKTGIKSLAFGMSVTNFSKEVKYEEEGFQLPLLFTIGISADLFDFFEMPGPSQSLLLSIDATHPRSHPEQLLVGLEYQFMKLISLRGGYIGGNSEDEFTFGVGITSTSLDVSPVNFSIDYSYTPFGVFNNVQRFTARISL